MVRIFLGSSSALSNREVDSFNARENTEGHIYTHGFEKESQSFWGGDGEKQACNVLRKGQKEDKTRWTYNRCVEESLSFWGMEKAGVSCLKS